MMAATIRKSNAFCTILRRKHAHQWRKRDPKNTLFLVVLVGCFVWLFGVFVCCACLCFFPVRLASFIFVLHFDFLFLSYRDTSFDLFLFLRFRLLLF